MIQLVHGRSYSKITANCRSQDVAFCTYLSGRVPIFFLCKLDETALPLSLLPSLLSCIARATRCLNLKELARYTSFLTRHNLHSSAPHHLTRFIEYSQRTKQILSSKTIHPSGNRTSQATKQCHELRVSTSTTLPQKQQQSKSNT